MNPFGIIGIIIGITNLAIGILVYLYDRKDSRNRLWALFAISVSIWGFGSYIISISTDPVWSLVWWRITLVGVIIIPFSFLSFTYSFLDRDTKSVNRLSISVATFFIAINCTPYFIPSVHWMFDSFYYDSPSLFYNLFVFCFFSTIAYAIILLFYSYYVCSNPVRKRQILFFTIASLIGALGGSTGFLPTYKISIYPYFNASIILFPFIIGYAISKHHLFNVRLITIELVTFALWIIILIRTLLAPNVERVLVEGSLLVITVVFGIVLIRSVLHEIKLQETVDQLTLELRQAYSKVSDLDKS